MAFGGSTVFEVRTTGSDTSCSGGFVPNNANMATDLAATSATTNNPVVTSASYTFVSSDIGHKLFIKSGTNWTPGWYTIISVNAGAATLDASINSSLSWSSPTSTNGSLSYVLNTVVGCSTVSSPTSGTWTIDYSQSDSARYNFTDMVIGVTTTQFTSAANPVGKNMVGNLVKVTSGTGFTVQMVEIVSVSGTTATCDKSLGTTGSTGGNGFLGGALAGPQLVAASLAGLGVDCNTIWIKSGTYTISSTSSNVANGIISVPSSSNAGKRIEGYGSVRGDMGTRPIFVASGITGVTLLAVSSGTELRNINVNGSSLSTITGILVNLRNNASSCSAFNCTTGFGLVNNGRYLYAENCTSGFSGAGSVLYMCVAKSCTTGFNNDECKYFNCISWNCTTGYSGRVSLVVNCLAYGGSVGFTNSSYHSTYVHCVASNCSSTGYNFVTNSMGRMENCFGYSNGTNFSVSVSYGVMYNDNFVALTNSPFVDPSNGNFTLNKNELGGKLLRNLSLSFPSLGTLSYSDAGAVQSKDEGSTGRITNLSRIIFSQ